jgi:hypothetical protein
MIPDPVFLFNCDPAVKFLMGTEVLRILSNSPVMVMSYHRTKIDKIC